MPRRPDPARRLNAAPPRRSVPAFGLYGEAPAAALPWLHIEEFQSRSSQYHWEIEAHVHSGLHQLMWLHAGPATVRLDGEPHALNGPAALVVPAGTVHSLQLAPDSDGHVLTLDPRALVENMASHEPVLAGLFAQARAWVPAAAAVPRIQRLVTTLAAEFAAADALSNPSLPWLARALAWRLAADLHQAQQAGAGGLPGPARSALFDRYVTLVEAHHLDHWPLARYAERLGLSLERLNRLTRQHCGRSALDLLHDRLAREACRRLVHQAMPVASLAFELGFSDPAYFSRFFKRRTGRSPSEFRRSPGEVRPPDGAHD